MNKIAVWMTVKNEARHLEAAIESVLAQTHRDFTLHISDNGSTDASREIIEAYAAKDNRITFIRRYELLAGIPHMAWMWQYLDGLDQDYTIHIGGHDRWGNEAHLATLLWRMQVESREGTPPALCYCDTWQIDEDGGITGRYKDFFQLNGNTGLAVIPQLVIAQVSSPQLFGLWDERIRRRVPMRHPCSGWDHLIVAEAAIRGPVLYEPGAKFLMRAPKPGASLPDYGRRHLDPAMLEATDRDFLNQLEWCIHTVDLALTDVHESAKSTYSSLLIASMVSTYLALRGQNLAIVPGADAAFNAHPEVDAILKALHTVREESRALCALDGPAKATGVK